MNGRCIGLKRQCLYSVHLPCGSSSRVLPLLQSSARMEGCLHYSCTRQPNFNFEGIQKEAYCRQHAVDGMVDVRQGRCSRDSCHKPPAFNFEGSKAACCGQHAEDGMVHVRTERCAQKACTKAPSYNFKGSTMRMYCKQHAEDGMVNVRYRLCSHSTCTKLSVYNVMGTRWRCIAGNIAGAAGNMFAGSFALMTLAVRGRASILRAKRQRCTARNMLKTRW